MICTLSINDSWSAHYDINHAKKAQGKDLRAHHLMLQLKFPIGYFSFTTSQHIGASITPTGTHHYSKLFTQKNYAQAYEVKFPLYKHSGNKATLSARISHSRASNLVGDVMLHTQNKPETQGKLETYHTGVIYQGVYGLTFSYEQGLSWFGAEVDSEQRAPGVSDKPKYQFKKISFHSVWNRPFTLFEQSLHYQLDCVGQYSKDEIVSSHQLSLAGPEQVRGFSKSYTGNRGIYCRQEVSWKHLLPFTRWLYPLGVSTGVDIGYLPKRSNIAPEDAQHVVLVSLVVASRYHVNGLTIDCTYAKPLYRNKEWGKLDQQGELYLSCSLHVHELIMLLAKRG